MCLSLDVIDEGCEWPFFCCCPGSSNRGDTVSSFLLLWKDIKNADLALFELSRVITLEPNRPEVYEQRAEVRIMLGLLMLHGLTRCLCYTLC